MDGPMKGVRVLDLSIALTGPYATALFADQGADVIKVERPGIGDIARWIGVAVNGMSSLYLVCNRGKRNIAVDLQHPEGVGIVKALAARSRRGGPELPARRHGQAWARLRRRESRQSGHRLCVALGLRGRGPLPRPRRLRHRHPGLRRVGGNQADPDDGVPVFLRQTAADKITALFASKRSPPPCSHASAGQRRANT